MENLNGANCDIKIEIKEEFDDPEILKPKNLDEEPIVDFKEFNVSSGNVENFQSNLEVNLKCEDELQFYGTYCTTGTICASLYNNFSPRCNKTRLDTTTS